MINIQYLIRLIVIMVVGSALVECVSNNTVLTEKVQKEVRPRLAFTSLEGERRAIYVVDAEGTGLQKVAGGRYKAIWPTWSSDGRRLGYLSDRDGNWEIYTTTSEGRATRRLTKTRERESGPAWSPIISGGPCAPPLADAPMPPGPAQSLAKPEDCFPDSWIAFIMNGEDDQLFIMRPDGTQRRQLTRTAGRKIAPSWSSDGTQIAFESDATGNWEIYKVGLDDPGPVRLTDARVNNETPVWSPDGRRIAFESEQGNNWEIYIMDADGSSIKRLTKTPGADSNPAWSPNGVWLAFDTIEQGKGEIYVMNADGSDLRNLTNHPADDIGPQWSPDGSQIAFSSDREGRYQIFILDLKENNLRQVTKSRGDNKWPFWSPK